MELVIDIPKSLYANLQKIQNGSIAAKRILECVRNGKSVMYYPQVEGITPTVVEPKTDVIDKIRAEIQGLRNCSCSNSDGIIDDVEDIIDKYKAESEDKE